MQRRYERRSGELPAGVNAAHRSMLEVYAHGLQMSQAVRNTIFDPVNPTTARSHEHARTEVAIKLASLPARLDGIGFTTAVRVSGQRSVTRVYIRGIPPWPDAKVRLLHLGVHPAKTWAAV